MDLPIIPALDHFSIVALVVLSFLSSALTAAVGTGGGLLMLSVMASMMPAAAVIPVHAIVQLGSNGGRALLARRHIVPRVTGLLLAGGAAGALLGSLLLLNLPLDWLQLSIAAFVLYMVWSPTPRIGGTSTTGIVLFGTFTSFLGLFVGATGPLVGAYIQRHGLNRHQLVASAAACMTGFNLFKLLVFGAAGFDLRAWLVLALLMIASGVGGTWVGLRLLGRLPERVFGQILRGVLSLLALHLGWRGLLALV